MLNPDLFCYILVIDSFSFLVFTLLWIRIHENYLFSGTGFVTLAAIHYADN